MEGKKNETEKQPVRSRGGEKKEEGVKRVETVWVSGGFLSLGW